MKYETVIGLEVHVQLLTQSKMFCACSTDYVQAPPNTHVCPICLGMPGVLPVINQQAVALVVTTGLALQSKIAEHTKFDRKNYPYPDLMKGYQISQYDAPICEGGYLTIGINGDERNIRLTRIHLEEDVAKMSHHLGDTDSYSLIDVNRSGIPLMEIVSEPDMRSAEEARNYLVRLRSIIRYLAVSTADMEKGSFRCDANISIRPYGSDNLSAPRAEVKNMNSFRAVYRALLYEAQRQEQLVRDGQRVTQETRGWIEERGITVSQRTKEYAHDYRYFPDPDLPPLTISRDWVGKLRALLPELPESKKIRFMHQYGLSSYDSDLLTASQAVADWYEKCIMAKPLTGELLKKRAKAISNWTLGEFSRLLNETGKEIRHANLNPDNLNQLQDMVEEGMLSTTLAKTVFEEIFHTGRTPKQIVQEGNYIQISDIDSLTASVEFVIENNPQAVSDFLDGKETATKFLMGQVMKKTQGKANPSLVSEIIKRQLEQLRSS